MHKGAYVWGVLAIVGVAAVSVFLFVGMPHAASAPAQDSGPLPVLTEGIQLDVAQKRPPLAQEQEAAINALATSDSGTEARPDPMQMAHFGALPEEALSDAEQVQLKQQVDVATAAVAGLDTPAEAARMGYTQASRELRGIGSHWVNWTLIDKPFDPAQPAMLLYATIGGVQKLVGYSYFIKSDTEPAGFAGPNDMWHKHGSICLLNGWLVSEGEDKDACPGTWLYASKLWMMHAWVNPEFKNPWGLFGMMNPLVCPDTLECEEFKEPSKTMQQMQHEQTH